MFLLRRCSSTARPSTSLLPHPSRSPPPIHHPTASPFVRFYPAAIPVPSSSLPTQKSTSHIPPTVAACPPSQCDCEANPDGLDIDQMPFFNSMPFYERHFVVCTGRHDWASKIEKDTWAAAEGNEFAAGLAGVLKKAQHEAARDPDPKSHITSLVTNSSFPPYANENEKAGSAYIFPTGLYIPRIPFDSSISSLLAPTIQPPSTPPHAHKLRSATILICSHNTRDSRCGAVYPSLRAQFEKVLAARHMLLDDSEHDTSADEGKVRVGATSHLSGHKWAGNVVVYLPGKGEEDGWGVWYGRVRTEHVEGIVDETVRHGRVITELCRGVIDSTGKVDMPSTLRAPTALHLGPRIQTASFSTTTPTLGIFRSRPNDPTPPPRPSQYLPERPEPVVPTPTPSLPPGYKKFKNQLMKGVLKAERRGQNMAFEKAKKKAHAEYVKQYRGLKPWKRLGLTKDEWRRRVRDGWLVPEEGWQYW